MEEILRRIPEFKAAARGMGEIVPADLVLIAEAPAPAGREERRIRVLLERCNETGVRPRAIGNCGSGFGIRLETDGNHRDLSAAGADSLRNQPEGPPGKIDAAAVSGAFLGDNSPALAANLGISVHRKVFARRRPGGPDFRPPPVGRAEAVQGALCLLSIPSRATSAAACFLQPRCPAAALRCAVPAAGADPDQTRRPTAVGTRADGRARPAGIVPAIDGDCGDD